MKRNIKMLLIAGILVASLCLSTFVLVYAQSNDITNETEQPSVILAEGNTVEKAAGSEISLAESDISADYRIVRLAEGVTNRNTKNELSAPAEATKNISLKGKSVSVKYSGVSYGKYEYVDSNDVKYYVSADGDFCGYFDMWGATRSYNGEKLTGEITEEVAVKIASAEGTAVFGDLFAPLTKISTFQSTDGSWCVSFTEPLGKDGFASGYECSVNIGPAGGIESCKLNGYSELADFDSSVLEDVTIDDIRIVISKRISELYGECPNLDFSLSEAFLNVDDEGYYLSIGVSGTYTNEEATKSLNRDGVVIPTRIDEWFFVYID